MRNFGAFTYRSTIRARPRRLSVLLAMLIAAAPAWAAELRSFELRYRGADEAVALLRELLPPDAAVSGRGFVVFVRADADALNTVSEVLQRWDRPPRMLRIEVRDRSHRQQTRDTSGADVTVDSGGARGRLQVQTTTTSEGDMGRQVVQVLEGATAYIGTGRRQPVVTLWEPRRRGGWVALGERRLQSGIRVRPQLQGDRVVLTLEYQRERPAQGGYEVEARAARTTVQGPLGQWLDVGGSAELVQRNESGIFYRSDVRDDFDSGLQVRVMAVESSPGHSPPVMGE